MRFLIILPIVFVNLVWSECPCEDPCTDSLVTTEFVKTFEQETTKKMKEIQDKIGAVGDSEDDFGADSAMGNLKKLHEITKEKLKSYSALRDLKQEELNELNKINSLLEKLIEQENTRIKILKIKAKDEVNSYE